VLMRIKRLFTYAVVSAGTLAMAGLPRMSRGEDAQPAAQGILGKTAPCEEAQMTLSSRSSDVVWDVKVKKGDVIKPGQILAVLDTREEDAELKTTQLMADSEVAIRAAQATRRQKELEVKRKSGDKTGAFSKFEKEQAELELELADWDIQKAELEQAKLKSQADTLRTQIERKKLVSRIGGIVREVNIEKGGVVDPQKPAIVVVNNSPLWVEVHLPVDVSLALGRSLRNEPNKKLEFGVLYAGAKTPIPAKPIFLDPKGDPAGDSVAWTLEIENQEQLPAGIKVTVIPPQLDKVAEAKVK